MELRNNDSIYSDGVQIGDVCVVSDDDHDPDAVYLARIAVLAPCRGITDACTPEMAMAALVSAVATTVDDEMKLGAALQILRRGHNFCTLMGLHEYGIGRLEKAYSPEGASMQWLAVVSATAGSPAEAVDTLRRRLGLGRLVAR